MIAAIVCLLLGGSVGVLVGHWYTAARIRRQWQQLQKQWIQKVARRAARDCAKAFPHGGEITREKLAEIIADTFGA